MLADEMMLKGIKVWGRPHWDGKRGNPLDFLLSIRNWSRCLSISPSPSSMGTGAESHEEEWNTPSPRLPDLGESGRACKKRDKPLAPQGKPAASGTPELGPGEGALTLGAQVGAGSSADRPQGIVEVGS